MARSYPLTIGQPASGSGIALKLQGKLRHHGRRYARPVLGAAPTRCRTGGPRRTRPSGSAPGGGGGGKAIALEQDPVVVLQKDKAVGGGSDDFLAQGAAPVVAPGAAQLHALVDGPTARRPAPASARPGPPAARRSGRSRAPRPRHTARPGWSGGTALPRCAPPRPGRSPPTPGASGPGPSSPPAVVVGRVISGSDRPDRRGTVVILLLQLGQERSHQVGQVARHQALVRAEAMRRARARGQRWPAPPGSAGTRRRRRRR